MVLRPPASLQRWQSPKSARICSSVSGPLGFGGGVSKRLKEGAGGRIGAATTAVWEAPARGGRGAVGLTTGLVSVKAGFVAGLPSVKAGLVAGDGGAPPLSAVRASPPLRVGGKGAAERSVRPAQAGVPVPPR